MQKLTIPSTAHKQVIDITGLVNDLLMKNFYDTGMCFLFAMHTSCALAIADLDAGTDSDFIAAYEAMLPKLNYKHQHDPSHVGDHIMASTIGMSLAIPVQSASMVLGQWQRIALIEFNGPKERRVILNFLPIK